MTVGVEPGKRPASNPGHSSQFRHSIGSTQVFECMALTGLETMVAVNTHPFLLQTKFGGEGYVGYRFPHLPWGEAEL